MKRVLVLIFGLALLFSSTFAFFGCTAATGFSFITPWVDKSSDIVYERSVYEVLRTDGNNDVLAKGVLEYVLDSHEGTDFSQTITLSMEHTSKVPENEGKIDTMYSKLIFGGGNSDIMIPKSLVKEMHYESNPDIDFKLECDFSDGARISHNFQTENGLLEYNRKKVELTAFDNEQLLLLVRSSSVEIFKPGQTWSYTLFSPADSVFYNNLIIRNLNVQLSSDTANIQPSDTFLSQNSAHTIDSADSKVVPCYKADLYIPSSSGLSGMTMGPSITAYYAQRPAYSPMGTPQSRLLIKYEQIDYSLQTGSITARTTYNIQSVSNTKTA